ncbi:unnamed protein product, partial [Gongylonema pulchrum]|uniref:Ig-like domain-containing protein n=1 Tax=Gongylonema pulchrum TaxID=637853 RepID=A0A183D7C6_9BILA
ARASDSGVYGCEFKVGSEVLSRVSSTLVVEIGAEEDWNKRREDVDETVVDRSLLYAVVACVITLILLSAGVCGVFCLMRKRKGTRQYCSVKSDSAAATTEKQHSAVEKDSAAASGKTHICISFRRSEK